MFWNLLQFIIFSGIFLLFPLDKWCFGLFTGKCVCMFFTSSPLFPNRFSSIGADMTWALFYFPSFAYLFMWHYLQFYLYVFLQNPSIPPLLAIGLIPSQQFTISSSSCSHHNHRQHQFDYSNIFFSGFIEIGQKTSLFD